MGKINRKNYNAQGRSAFENGNAKVWHVNQALQTFGSVVQDALEDEVTINATVGAIIQDQTFDIGGSGAGVSNSFTVYNSEVKANSIIMVSAYARLTDNDVFTVTVRPDSIEDGVFRIDQSYVGDISASVSVTIVFQIYTSY
jgi:hypothetical protein